MNPFIWPPLMSATAARCVCGPPSNSTADERYGGTHRPPWYGSGTQTENDPSGFVGMPSAPG